MSLTPAQREFVSQLSHDTGLDPHVVAAWTTAEESGGAAQAREHEDNHNWLNIGYFDSGPGQIAFNSAFHSPRSAASQTAKFLKGEWGGASPGIRSILGTTRDGANAQMNAIAHSGWASSGYNGGNTLRQLYGEYKGQTFKGAQGPPGNLIPTLGGSAFGPTSPGLGPVEPFKVQPPGIELQKRGSPFDVLSGLNEGLNEKRPQEDETQRIIQENFNIMAKMFDIQHNPLHNQTSPHSSEVPMGTSILNLPPGGHVAGHGKLGGFIPGNAALTLERLDQGQDIMTTPGGPIIAPGSGKVVAVLNDPNGFGYGYPVVEFTSGRFKGEQVYIGHTHSVLQVGDHFEPGQILSHTGYGTPKEGNARTPGWAEIGFWNPNKGPRSMEGGKQIAPYLK